MPILSPIGAATSGAFGLPKSASGSAGDPYYEYVTLLLTGDGTNGAQNNTFLDSSSNAFSITRNGNTTQGSFSPYGSLWSNYFDGSSRLSLASNSAFAFGTGDFTIEFWMFQSNASSYGIFTTDQLNVANSLQIYTESNGGLTAQFSGSPEYQAQTGALSKNTWHHCALVRTSGTSQWYVDGVATGSSASTPSNITATSSVLVGSFLFSGSYYDYTGYLSNLRVTKGGALYSSTFTPSTTPLTTSVSAGTVSLLTCQSNRFVDNSSNAFSITVGGTPSVQRFSPFNPTASYDTATIGGSGYFDGSGDYLNAGVNSAFSFGTGNDFCIEGWVYPNGTTPLLWFGSHQPGQADGYYSYLNPPRLEVFSGGGGGGGPTSTTTPTINAWSHIAITRQSSVFRVFLNGVMTGYSTNNKQVNQDGRSFCLAGLLSGGDKLNGFISNFRICNGSVPTSYQTSATSTGTSVFTPPTSPMTTSSQGASNVVFLVNMTNAGIPDYAMMNDLETVGNAQVSTSVKKFGTGSIAFDGTGDYLKVPNNPVYWFGTGEFTVETWVYINSNQAYAEIIDTTGGGGSNNGWFLEYSATRGLVFFFGTGSAQVLVEYATTPPTSTWQHIAVCRSGGTVYLYIDGVSVASSSIAVIGNPTAVTTVYIGSGGAEYYLNGYLDDLRITKGYARYPSGTTFTPPTAALPTY